MRLNQVVSMTLETDIPQYANYTVKVSRKLKELMQVIADSVPFKPNMSTIATTIKVDRNNLPDYFELMERAGLIAQLHESTGGVRGLGKVERCILIIPTSPLHSLLRCLILAISERLSFLIRCV